MNETQEVEFVEFIKRLNDTQLSAYQRLLYSRYGEQLIFNPDVEILEVVRKKLLDVIEEATERRRKLHRFRVPESH